MKIKSCNQVCDILLPGVERPINSNFEIDGIAGIFSICTVEFMRGWAGLQNGEHHGDYYMTFFGGSDNPNEEIRLRVNFSPVTSSYKVRDFSQKRAKQRVDYEEVKSKAFATIISACVEAIP